MLYSSGQMFRRLFFFFGEESVIFNLLILLNSQSWPKFSLTGREMKMEHYRNNEKLRDLTDEADYSYDSPKSFP